MDARDADPVHVASLQERRSPDLGHPAVPQLSARPQLPVLLGESAARVQLLRLSRQHARRPAAAASGRSPRRRAVRELQLVGSSDRRSRIAAGDRPDAAAHRRRRQVHAQFGHRRRPHRQAGLLAGRVGRRANLRERTVRAVRPGKALLLPRGRRSVPDADSGGLHAHDHRTDVGRADHRKGRGRPVHRARCRGRWRRKRGAARGIWLVTRVSGLRLDRVCGTGQARYRPLVHQHARDRPRRPRLRVVQPRGRPRFPVAPECHRGDHRAVARQRHAHAESAGPCAGVDGPVDDLARRPASVEPQHDAI